MKATGRRYIKQVNNFKIYLFPDGKAQCVAPDGSVLATFGTIERAIVWATKTTDFLKRQG